MPNDAQNTAMMLRALADRLEGEEWDTFQGEFALTRQQPISEAEIESWSKAPNTYVAPWDLDRTCTTKFHVNLERIP